MFLDQCVIHTCSCVEFFEMGKLHRNWGLQQFTATCTTGGGGGEKELVMGNSRSMPRHKPVDT